MPSIAVGAGAVASAHSLFSVSQGRLLSHRYVLLRPAASEDAASLFGQRLEHLITHHKLLNFTRYRHGIFGDKPHVTRNFEVCDLILTKRFEFIFGH